MYVEDVNGKMTDSRILKIIIFYFISCLGLLSCNVNIDVPGMLGRPVNPMLAKHGDIYVAVLVHVSPYDAVNKRCGPGPSSGSCDQMEMVIYATELVNRRADLLPNITLGFVAVDGCANDMMSLEAVTYLLADEEANCPADIWTTSVSPLGGKASFSSELRHRRPIGLVMVGTSRVAAAISPLMGTYEIPLIGMTSTSDELSDKSRYEYFLRLSTADTYQAFAVLNLARYFGWKYVSVIYSEGTYGENGMNQISAQLKGDASGYGICIAVAARISLSMTQQDFDDIADKLISNRNARVIIVYVETQFIIKPLFDGLNKKVPPNTFNLLSGDAIHFWEFQQIIQYDITEGAIFLEHVSVSMPDFEAYLATTTPSVRQGDAWILGLWEQRYGCRFGGTPPCDMNMKLDSNMCPVIPVLDNRIQDAVTLFAEAAHRVLAEFCPDELSRRSEQLQNCLRGDRILQTLLNGTYHGIIGTIQFTNKGDYLGNLQVKQYVTMNGVRSSKLVGFWNIMKSEVTINESLIEWDMFYNQSESTESVNKPPISVCSLPCEEKTYVIQQAIPCCWICAKCRSNEVILPTRKGCAPCPAFHWPDEQTGTSCPPIVPVYLHYSDVISICMICLAVLVAIVVVMCAVFFIVKRQNRLVKALSVQLSLLILFGKLIACITVILQLVPADSTPGICVARSVGFHVGICAIYSPLLVKNIRIYRIFAAGKRSTKAPRFVSAEAQLLITFVVVFIQLILVTVSEILSASSAALNMPSPFEKYVELYCSKSTVWFLIPLAYNIVVMLLCAAIGFVTRKLPNNFNESWFIFISVATTLFSWVVFIPAYFSVSQAYLQAAILGFALVLICIVTLSCQYVPVVYALLFVPKENVIAVGTVGTINTVSPQ